MTTRATYPPHRTRLALERSIAAQPTAYIDPDRWVESGPGEPHYAKGTVVGVERYGDEWRLSLTWTTRARTGCGPRNGGPISAPRGARGRGFSFFSFFLVDTRSDLNILGASGEAMEPSRTTQEADMNRYIIESITTGHVFGMYEGDTAEDAIEALREDAGADPDTWDASDCHATPLPTAADVVGVEDCSADWYAAAGTYIRAHTRHLGAFDLAADGERPAVLSLDAWASDLPDTLIDDLDEIVEMVGWQVRVHVGFVGVAQ